MSTPSSRLRVQVVCYRLDVAAGIERALAAIIPPLADEMDLDLVLIRGGQAQTLAAPLGRFAQVRELRMRPWRWAAVRFGSRRYDATLVVGLWAGVLWLGVTGRFANRPIVLWEHSLVEARLPNDKRLRRGRRVIWRAFKQADALVSVSNIAGDYLRSTLSPAQSMRVSVIPNALNQASERPKRSARNDGKIRVLALHRFTALKNTQLAIRAMAELPPEYELVCLGDGPERPALTQLVNEMSLGDRVVFAGFVDDVAPFLSDADVVVHPSLAETFCVAAFEAAAAHVPFVCLNVGSLSDSVPDHVPGVKLDVASDPATFASGILAAVSGHSEQLFAEADRRRAIELSPAHIAGCWLSLFRGLTHAGG